MATAPNTTAVAGSSAESEAFRKCSSDLLRGIQDPEVLAWELYSENVVSETVVDEVGLLGLSAIQRKAKLLSAVRDQITVDPAKFQNLLLALKKQPPMINIAEKLESIFKSCTASQPEESAHTYNLGFPVELLREAWYHRGITRESAEERLEHATSGCFLVRESETKPGCFSLSLKLPGDIAHFPIQRKDSGLYEVPGTHKGFTTLPDLVNYFKHNSISEDPHHVLSSPCLKAPPNANSPSGQTPGMSNSPPPPPIPKRGTAPIPVPRKRHQASGKHTADISPQTKASPNDDQRSSNTILPHAQDNKSLLLHPHSRLRWRRGADLPVAMNNSRIVGIANKVYCGGGKHTAWQLFQYDSKRDEWSPLPNCPAELFDLTQWDGKLVTVGGRRLGDHCIPISDVYVFEESQTWEKSIPPLLTARICPTAFAYKSTLVVSGGIIHWDSDRAHSTRTTAVEVFQTKSSQWYCAEPLPLALSSMSHAIINDTCYLIGWGTVGCASRQTYCISIPSLIETAFPVEKTSTTPQASPSLLTWQVLAQCPLYYSAAAELGGCLMAIGGMDNSADPSSAVHVYSPTTNSWERISSGDLPEPRFFGAATQLEARDVILVGGKGGMRNFTTTVFITSIE